MAELKPYNPSWREQTKQTIAGALTNLGMDNYRAQKIARGFTGSMRPDLNIAEGMGVLDFTPAGLLFAGNESIRGLRDAKSGLDYAIEIPIAALTFGEGVAKSYPVTKSLTNFLKNQARKFKSPSIADEIVDDQKRKTLKTLATVPAAAVATEPLIGALGNLPKGKVAKEMPFTTVKKIDKIMDSADASSLKKLMPDPKTLFAWFNKGNADNLFMKSADDFLEKADGDIKKANDLMIEQLDGNLDFYDAYPDDFPGESRETYFEENVVNMLKEDLTE